LTTHELKTPLSAMIATAEVLKLGFYDNEEQMKAFVNTIFTEGMHRLEIVNDILDFSKIQAGKMEFFIEFLNLSDIVSTVIENFQKMAG
ncbi:MAG: hypothetical protein KDD25_06015, partial [Bdellovibrionales bacterium]|nr:hypothetical protein [Bdellovibrionales bacterium]